MYNFIAPKAKVLIVDDNMVTLNFEKELLFQKENGVEVCIFGDIDIEEHLEWCTKRCKAVGIEAFFPLWKEERRALVEEFIKVGFKANITVIDTTRLSEKHLGRCLSAKIISSIVLEGADACGENGEYHTFVFDGPLFKNKIQFETGKNILTETHGFLDIR